MKAAGSQFCGGAQLRCRYDKPGLAHGERIIPKLPRQVQPLLQAGAVANHQVVTRQDDTGTGVG
jgi:hypothetical protein